MGHSDVLSGRKGGTTAKPVEASSLRANFGAPDWLVGPFVNEGAFVRRVIAAIHACSMPFVKVACNSVSLLPCNLKNQMMMMCWQLWLALHEILPACIARRGLSDDMSIEQHALYNVLWWSRMMPTDVWMCRWALSELGGLFPPREVPNEWIESVHTPGLCSCYMHLTPPSETNPKCLVWAYGGAFVAGDVNGQRGLAQHYGRLLGCDVFVVHMRLCPENQVQDAVIDLYRAYEWLLKKVPAENILMLGVSSGGGSILRTLQLAAGDEAMRKEYFGERRPLPPSLPQPAGVIGFGPFVDYARLSNSIKEYPRFDWIVNQSIIEMMLPMKETLAGGIEELEMCSPIYHSMKGLAPVFISVSDHECLIDEDKELFAKCKAAGVDVVLSTRPFMPHIFQLLSPFLPEAREEELRICDWARARGGVWA